jgi:acetyl-CoA carboxylase biotin carboxyl carrier protein
VNLSPDDVDDILRVLDSSDYDELHIDTGRFVLTLRRETGGWTQEHEVRAQPGVLSRPEAADAGEPSMQEGPAAATVRTTPAAAIGGAEERAGSDGLRAVTAPLPGVFYRSPRPGAAPFVEVADRVEGDTVVCILETMKLMNAVVAGADGTVAAISVGNGEPVGQATVLMWLRPDPA